MSEARHSQRDRLLLTEPRFDAGSDVKRKTDFLVDQREMPVGATISAVWFRAIFG